MELTDRYQVPRQEDRRERRAGEPLGLCVHLERQGSPGKRPLVFCFLFESRFTAQRQVHRGEAEAQKGEVRMHAQGGQQWFSVPGLSWGQAGWALPAHVWSRRSPWWMRTRASHSWITGTCQIATGEAFDPLDEGIVNSIHTLSKMCLVLWVNVV